MHPVIEWKNNRVTMIDQRKLPGCEEYIEHSGFKEVARSIESMVIRGAPAIGVAAAMGIALGVIHSEDPGSRSHFNRICARISRTRPTAVNLFWAVNRMKRVFEKYHEDPEILKTRMVEEAIAMDREDVQINRRLGSNGAPVIHSGQRILTHCNAGALATAGYGTALGVIRSAVSQGKDIRVIASETRPFLQGARLTVWELQKDRIPVTLITDNMAGYLMSRGKVDLVITGADRIAANGDTANKIGTYSLAVLSHYHHIPFYVAAPVSTIDFGCREGSEIPIEERDKNEVLRFLNQPIAPRDTEVHNPAFDITPASLITGIITEEKLHRSPFQDSLSVLSNQGD